MIEWYPHFRKPPYVNMSYMWSRWDLCLAWLDHTQTHKRHKKFETIEIAISCVWKSLRHHKHVDLRNKTGGRNRGDNGNQTSWYAWTWWIHAKFAILVRNIFELVLNRWIWPTQLWKSGCVFFGSHITPFYTCLLIWLVVWTPLKNMKVNWDD